jgi:hypothetical protein
MKFFCGHQSQLERAPQPLASVPWLMSSLVLSTLYNTNTIDTSGTIPTMTKIRSETLATTTTVIVNIVTVVAQLPVALAMPIIVTIGKILEENTENIGQSTDQNTIVIAVTIIERDLILDLTIICITDHQEMIGNVFNICYCFYSKTVKSPFLRGSYFHIYVMIAKTKRSNAKI